MAEFQIDRPVPAQPVPGQPPAADAIPVGSVPAGSLPGGPREHLSLPTTRSALRAVGVSILIELAAVLCAAALWLGAVLFT